MRPLVVILILIALALGAWNWWQIHEVRRDLRMLGEPDGAADASAGKHAAAVRDLLSRADAELAETAGHLQSGDTEAAKGALERAIRDLDAAAQLMGEEAEGRSLLDAIRDAVVSAKEAVSSLGKKKSNSENGEADKGD